MLYLRETDKQNQHAPERNTSRRMKDCMSGRSQMKLHRRPAMLHAMQRPCRPEPSQLCFRRLLSGPWCRLRTDVIDPGSGSISTLGSGTMGRCASGRPSSGFTRLLTVAFDTTVDTLAHSANMCQEVGCGVTCARKLPLPKQVLRRWMRWQSLPVIRHSTNTSNSARSAPDRGA